MPTSARQHLPHNTCLMLTYWNCVAVLAPEHATQPTNSSTFQSRARHQMWAGLGFKKRIRDWRQPGRAQRAQTHLVLSVEVWNISLEAFLLIISMSSVQ